MMVTHFRNVPLNPLHQLRQEVDRLMAGFISGMPEPVLFGVGRAEPPMNVWEGDESITIEAELPGCKQDDIEVSVVGDELMLKVERRESEPEGVTLHRRERPEGGLSRVMRLPVAVDPDRVRAQLADGVLSITLTKAPSAKPRKITVTTA